MILTVWSIFLHRYKPCHSMHLLKPHKPSKTSHKNPNPEPTMEPPLAKHIIMLPFMAQGHLIPFLELAHHILTHNPTITITIVNTPLNIHYLRSATTNHPQLHLKPLPFNSSDHHLPPNSENTDGLPLTQIIKLFHASTALEKPFRNVIHDVVVLEKRNHVCIVSDIFMGWANDVAKSFNIFNYSFSTGGAYGTAAYCSIWLNLPHRSLSGGTHEEFAVPGFPESCRFTITQLHQFLRAADGKDEWSRFFQVQISLSLRSNGWLCNTVEEIEPLGLEVLRNYIKLPVWCIGPLIPFKMLKKNLGLDTGLGSGVIGPRSGKQPGIRPEKCIEWLDSRATGSVLYISFGSQNTIGESQMMELAKGLEESKRPFIWVIRPPIGFDLKGDFWPEWLPNGFKDRTGKQGLVVHNWAPQLEILCHRATGAFLSHCGWNSVMESLSQGVPIIGWPMAAEQGYNAKMLVEEMGVCEVLTRGVHSRITKEEVSRVINVVLDKSEGGKGEDMRKKASKFGDLMRASVEDNKGSSYRAMDEFLTSAISV